MNIARTLLDGTANKEDVVLNFNDTAYTFGELDSGICSIMETIDQLAPSAERVAIFMLNSPEMLQSLYAVWAQGRVVVILSPLLGQQELKILLEQNKPDMLLISDDTAEKWQAVKDAVQSPVYNVSRRTVKAPDGRTAVELVTERDPEDPAVIIFTSGSTGVPKGVVITHSAMFGSIHNTLKRIIGDRPRKPKQPGARKFNIVSNPMFHISGLYHSIFTFEVGRALKLLKKFDVDQFTKSVEEAKINSVNLNASMMKMILDQKELALPRLKSVKFSRAGAMPLPDKLKAEFERVFGIRVLRGYGQTEAGGEVIGWSGDDLAFAETKFSSIGRPHPNVELAVKDAQGNHLPTGEIGEICLRGDHFMKAYTDSNQKPPYDEEGFLRTGDLGYVDEDGFVFLTGRLRNIIIAGGFNIYPEEVENILFQYPGIEDIGVAPLADERLGEIPVAVLQRSADQPFDPERFIQFARENLAHYKVPRKVFFVDALPKTGNDKLDRPALRHLLEQMTAENATANQ